MGGQRVAGATVEEPISDDINAWQEQVAKKPPLGTQNVAGPSLGGETCDGKSTRGMCKSGRNHPLWEVKPAKVLMGTHVWHAHMAGRSVAEPRL